MEDNVSYSVEPEHTVTPAFHLLQGLIKLQMLYVKHDVDEEIIEVNAKTLLELLARFEAVA